MRVRVRVREREKEELRRGYDRGIWMSRDAEVGRKVDAYNQWRERK